MTVTRAVLTALLCLVAFSCFAAAFWFVDRSLSPIRILGSAICLLASWQIWTRGFAALATHRPKH